MERALNSHCSIISRGFLAYLSRKFTDCFFVALYLVILMVVTTKVAKASLDKALAEDGDIEGILGSPRLPIVAEPPLDLQKPLIIKIDSPGNHHEKQ